MNKNMNIIGLIGTSILLLLVVLSVEKKYIQTNFKKEIHPSQKIGYAIAASENFNGNIDGIQGILENYNKLNDFCNPESLTFCAKPEPFKYEIDPELLKVPNRIWNPSKINGNQGPMGAGPIGIPTMALTSNSN
jgi:hypothetical protein